MDCGHGGICNDCGVRLLKENGLCILCREEINHILQIDINSMLDEKYIRVLKTTYRLNKEAEEAL